MLAVTFATETRFQTVLIQESKHGHTGLEEAILTLGYDRGLLGAPSLRADCPLFLGHHGCGG